ncbi:MAG: helix-turn-helix transcriptional regulator [Sphingobacteriaceae bacterium]|nr:helix-turn-helix transcriptional regulator [Sphingobacteriaceae bacterium]
MKKTIHTRLEELRISAGLNKVEFASYLGISKQRYQQMIVQEYNFKVDLIEKLMARRPDLNVHWLFTGTGRMVNMTAYEQREEEITDSMVAEPMAEYNSGALDACKEKVRLLEELLAIYRQNKPDVGPTLDQKK